MAQWMRIGKATSEDLPEATVMISGALAELKRSRVHAWIGLKARLEANNLQGDNLSQQSE